METYLNRIKDLDKYGSINVCFIGHSDILQDWKEVQQELQNENPS